MNDARLDYDQVLQNIGGCGRWQISLFLLLWLPAALSSISIFLFHFAAFTPDHICTDTSNSSYDTYQQNNNNLSQFSSCFPPIEQGINSTAACSAWEFDTSIIHSSAVEDFLMVCQHSWKKSLADTCNMAGMLVGSLLCGLVSDKLGRKPALMLSIGPLLLGGCLPLSFPSTPQYYPVLLVSRIISGMGAVGAFILSLCLSVEYVGASYRVALGILIQVPFTLGGLLVGLASWAGVRHWKVLVFVMSIPNLFILAYWWLIPESPRWLLVQKDHKEYEKVIQQASKINGRPLPNKTVAPLLHSNSISKQTSENDLSAFSMFTSWVLLKRFAVMILNWFIVFLCYFGITSISSSFSTDFYLNYTLVFLVDLPSQLFCLLCLDKVGRRIMFGGSQVLAGISFLAACAVNYFQFDNFELILTLIGKFGTSAALAVMFVFTAELFPTNIRNTAVGTCSLFARLGGMLAPLVVSLQLSVALIIMGSLSFVGGISILASLPETTGKQLPDNLEEARDLEKPRRRNTAEEKLI